MCRSMAENVADIREKMARAALAAGRSPSEVLLCAACKTRTVETVRESAALPIDLFGENHVQELVEKTDAGAYLGTLSAICRPIRSKRCWGVPP